jgi:hypothetical protein
MNNPPGGLTYLALNDPCSFLPSANTITKLPDITVPRQLEADFSQNLEFNRFLQTMALKGSKVKKILIGEIARSVEDSGSVAPECASRT